MKHVKFKNNNKFKSFKILLTVLFTIIICNIIITNLCNKISNNLLNTAKKIIIKDNVYQLNRLMVSKDDDKTIYDRLITIEKNKNNEILDVSFNIYEAEKLLFNIIDNLEKINDYYLVKGKILYIPLGQYTNSPLTYNLGPKLPINIKLANNINGNIKTKIKEYGINNVYIELYMEIIIKLNFLLPNLDKTQTIKQDILLTSKIIGGRMPQFYNGSIIKDSRNINLPIK